MSRNKSRLLNPQDHCLILQPSLVQTLGKSATLFLQQVHYSLTHPNFGKEIEGCRWVHHTLEEWVERIKIISKSTLKRSISYLKKIGVLCIKHLSFKKSDRTNWYSINYKALSDLLENSCNEEKLESEVLRPFSKLAFNSQVRGDLGAQNRSVLNTHEDSSTKSTPQLTSEGELRERSVKSPENEAPEDQNHELKMSPSSAQNEPMYKTERILKSILINLRTVLSMKRI